MTIFTPDTRVAEPCDLTVADVRGWMSRWSKVMLIAADVVVVALGFSLAYGLRNGGFSDLADKAHHGYLTLCLVGLVGLVVVFFHYRLYSARHIASRLEEWRRLNHATGAAILLMVALGYLADIRVSRGWIALSFFTVVLCLSLEREIMRRVFGRLRKRGLLSRPVVIVGANGEAVALRHMLDDDGTLGYRVVGVVDDCALTSPPGPVVDQDRKSVV